MFFLERLREGETPLQSIHAIGHWTSCEDACLLLICFFFLLVSSFMFLGSAAAISLSLKTQVFQSSNVG